MAKSTRATAGPNTGVPPLLPVAFSSQQELLVVGTGAVRRGRDRRIARTRPVSSAASAKKMWFSAAENEIKSSGFQARNPAEKIPMSTIYTSVGNA